MHLQQSRGIEGIERIGCLPVCTMP